MFVSEVRREVHWTIDTHPIKFCISGQKIADCSVFGWYGLFFLKNQSNDNDFLQWEKWKMIFQETVSDCNLLANHEFSRLVAAYMV